MRGAARPETDDPVQVAYDKAVNLFASGQRQAADALLARVLSHEPERHGALHLRGVIAAMDGDPGRAVELIESALKLDSDNAAYWGNLGTALKKLGWLHEAAEAFGRAMELDPKKSDFATGLGLVMEDLGKTDEALAAHRLALQKNPGLAPAAYNLGRLLAQLGEPVQATELLRQAIEINPRYIRAYNELGVLFQTRGDEDAAIATFQAGLDVDPAAVDPLKNLCFLFCQQGRFEQAEIAFLQALQAAPEQADLHWSYGLLQLRRGRFAEGWGEAAWRWKTAQGRQLAARHQIPTWDGTPLGDRRLLVWAEPGLAEQLLFSTVLPDLTWLGGSVTVECDPRLTPLLQRSFERLAFVQQGDFGADRDAFDCQIPLGDLPRFYRAGESDFPKRRASLMTDADRVAKIGARALRKARGRLLVGLARCGAVEEHHGLPNAALLPLLETRGCQFITLRPGPSDPASGENEVKSLGEFALVDKDDLDGFAAQMAAFDLVIALDELAAHLAGAVGVTAWAALPRLPSWCWMLEREDSPWYPALRLFRQESAGDWQGLVTRLRTELDRFAEVGAA